MLMTAPETPGRASFDLPRMLQDQGIGMGPVERSKRLIKDSPATQGRVVEFYSSLVGGRLLAMALGSSDSQVHREMAERGMPVFAEYQQVGEELHLLGVPFGTRLLGSSLWSMAGDLHRYIGLFSSIVDTQRLQHQNELGVFVASEDVRLLDHFAFAPDNAAPGGQRILLVPPYDIAPDATPETFAAALLGELQETGVFSELQVDFLRLALVGEGGGGAS